MMKLIPRFKTGYKTPDWDPTNPYHYHTPSGEKVVVTPEDWEKYKDDPTFREVRAAVEAEQTAYPKPEYEVDPSWLKTLNEVYASQRYLPGNNYYNYKYFANQLPEGYTINENGLVFDSSGNAYVQGQFNGGKNFTYDRSKPITFTFNQGKPIERNVNFYPVNMNKRVKPPLPVDKIIDVGNEKAIAVNNYINNNRVVENSIIPTYNIGYVTKEEVLEPDWHINGNSYNTKEQKMPYLYAMGNPNKPVVSVLEEDENIINDFFKELYNNRNYVRNEGKYPDITKEQALILLKKLNFDNIIDVEKFRLPSKWDITTSTKRNPSRQEAEKKAVISIGPLEKVKTFANGGHLFQKGGKVKGYKLSSKLMHLAQKFADKEAAKQNEEEGNGAPQSTFLMNRKNQQKVFEQEGYTKVDSDDYGPVTNAVKNSKHKDVPIYQKYPDVNVDRNNLIKIGTFMDHALKGVHAETEIYNGPYESYLTDPANFPVDIYIDRKTGKIYNQGWDFNDYNNLRSTTDISKLKNIAGNVLDRIGNPTVVTTGLQENENPPKEIIDNYISKASNGFLQYNSNDGQIQLKPVTITAQHTKKLIPRETKDLPTTGEFRNMSADQLFDWLEQNRKK